VATRASVVPEQIGIPSVVMVCKGFETAAEFTAQGRGTFNMPKAVFGRHVDTFTTSELEEHVRTSIVDQVVTALTVQPPDAKPRMVDPDLTDIVFSGTFEEVNEHFYTNEWSDGLPIVPPTVEKVQAFLRFTDRRPEEAIGSLLPDSREATIWSIAVNGVMAGCRPEHMPILIALVEVMADPGFGLRHTGATPGSEMQIYLMDRSSSNSTSTTSKESCVPDSRPISASVDSGDSMSETWLAFSRRRLIRPLSAARSDA